MSILIDAYENKDEADIMHSLREFSSHYNLDSAMFIHSFDHIFCLGKENPLEPVSGGMRLFMDKLTSLL